MSSPKIVEGVVDFSVPSAGKPCQTWYKVVGDLKSDTRPLVCLHGGPGCSHHYLLNISDITSSYGIPTIFYDQIGNAASTHLPEKKGDASFWTVQLFLDELDNLLAKLGVQDDYDLLGQSWGGMLGACHATRQPKGLKRLIIADSPSDMRSFVAAANVLRTKLPPDVQDALNKHEADGTTDSKDYEAAVEVFYSRHLCRLNPMPEELVTSLEWTKKDPTVYLTM